VLSRIEEAFELDKEIDTSNGKPAIITTISSKLNEDELELPDNIDFLKKKQKERLHGKKE